MRSGVFPPKFIVTLSSAGVGAAQPKSPEPVVVRTPARIGWSDSMEIPNAEFVVRFSNGSVVASPGFTTNSSKPTGIKDPSLESTCTLMVASNVPGLSTLNEFVTLLLLPLCG